MKTCLIKRLLYTNIIQWYRTSEEEPDDNYDDEIATAYEEFLRDSKCK